MEEWVAETDVRNWDQSKDVENDENDDGMCEKCCDAGGKYPNMYVDAFQGAAQGCTLIVLSLNLFIT